MKPREREQENASNSRMTRFSRRGFSKGVAALAALFAGTPLEKQGLACPVSLKEAEHYEKAEPTHLKGERG